MIKSNFFSNETLKSFENYEELESIEAIEAEAYIEDKSAKGRENKRDLFSQLQEAKKSGDLDIIEMLKQEIEELKNF